MNRLPARIVSVDCEGSLALIEAEAIGRRYTALLLGAAEARGWQAGTPITLLFQETEVSLAKDLSGRLSLRNRFPCRVTGIAHGRLLTRVLLDCGGHALASVVTTRSAQALELAEGDTVEGLVKANEMTVAPSEAS